MKGVTKVKLNVRVNRKRPESMTRQIREQFNALIDAGTLAAGTLLPSERELANTLDVARNVVRGAYEQLMDAGKLRSEGRKGRSVKSGRKKKAAAKSSKTSKARKKKFTRIPAPIPLCFCMWTRASYSDVAGASLPSDRISFLIAFRSARRRTKYLLRSKKKLRA